MIVLVLLGPILGHAHGRRSVHHRRDRGAFVLTVSASSPSLLVPRLERERLRRGRDRDSWRQPPAPRFGASGICTTIYVLVTGTYVCDGHEEPARHAVRRHPGRRRALRQKGGAVMAVISDGLHLRHRERERPRPVRASRTRWRRPMASSSAPSSTRRDAASVEACPGVGRRSSSPRSRPTARASTRCCDTRRSRSTLATIAEHHRALWLQASGSSKPDRPRPYRAAGYPVVLLLYIPREPRGRWLRRQASPVHGEPRRAPRRRARASPLPSSASDPTRANNRAVLHPFVSSPPPWPVLGLAGCAHEDGIFGPPVSRARLNGDRSTLRSAPPPPAYGAPPPAGRVCRRRSRSGRTGLTRWPLRRRPVHRPAG